MDIALTLVVNPAFDISLENIENKVTDLLSLNEYRGRILSENRAMDLIFETKDHRRTREMLTPALTKIEGLDWALQAAKKRKKKLLLADMDSTIITVECIDELADFVGLKDKVSEITESAMRGELDFEEALKERVALLKGLTASQLDECYEDRIELMGGARTLIQTVKANGGYAALVSGGFTFFTEKVAERVGFDMTRANVLEIADDQLTGMVVPPICGAQTKLDTLNELAEKLELEQRDIIAVGDGANDIPMLEAAGLGVAYHAKPKTRAAARAAVTYNDLTALLYFQGYSDADFSN
ncbi:phosphoserine phosphatase SerB [Kordiimonas sp. SCSIO 12603]|uniref:phosphoserine phosphatase SerB n=1 Tax=Kordiimonas sp. SCSIO 12603 TaxID=2829596 RepID=UPI00210406F9|nr:phosphoserine phosphatase SerB [Kordiimonas sp. SCSIO 12603]UTW57875.1 phosphoserine phosphatase SerB [Kordiimonas sp. SCSIO 12603]